MSSPTIILANAIGTQFGPFAVYLMNGDGSMFLFSNSHRDLFIRFVTATNDKVPVRAVEVSRRGELDELDVQKLAHVDIATNGLLTSALLNGYDTGEDTTLAQQIEDAKGVVTNGE